MAMSTGLLIRGDRLEPLGRNQSFYYDRCVDCGTEYPRVGRFSFAGCNGHSIDRCPFCRPDSKPWTNGRGC